MVEPSNSRTLLAESALAVNVSALPTVNSETVPLHPPADLVRAAVASKS